MNVKVKKLVGDLLAKRGYTLKRARRDGLPLDFNDSESELVNRVRPYTMTREERIVGLQRAVRYVCNNSIPGDFVECGVWKGGSSMVAAIEFQACGDLRDLYLLDSYDLPIPPPLEIDTDLDGTKIFGGVTEEVPYWQCVTDTEVEKNLLSTGYPKERLRIIKGLVTDTVPAECPEKISILRLDTDTYESTKLELEHLYPRLVEKGVLVLDDYGTHGGVRSAVDEYFKSVGTFPLITRVDTAGALAIKV